MTEDDNSKDPAIAGVRTKGPRVHTRYLVSQKLVLLEGLGKKKKGGAYVNGP